MKEKQKMPKFAIDESVRVSISDVPATVTAISMRRRPYSGYHSDNDIYFFYTVKVQFRVIGKPEFTSILTEYEERELTASI